MELETPQTETEISRVKKLYVGNIMCESVVQTVTARNRPAND